MHYSFVALALTALLAPAVHANPIASIPPLSAAAAHFPISQLNITEARHSGTSPRGGIAVDTTQATFPANLLLCPSVNCLSCFSINLANQPLDECFAAPGTFITAAISQPSNQGLPFGVLVGTSGCASVAQLPAVNECFNLNGPGAFDTFAFV
ncbi:hypothetical protein C8Q77DRAFT_305620 [Trametes polyzona]|nr:hypothetical protein C8Q77DRAFT_305620 [Trametes polyzona]